MAKTTKRTDRLEEEHLDLLEDEMWDAAGNSLLGFTLYSKPNYRVNWHHRAMCSLLDRFVAGKLPRLIIMAPPRHGKSELVSRRLPAYIFSKKPDAQIIACSYNTTLASKMNRDVQRIMDPEEFRRRFPQTQLPGKGIRTTVTWKRTLEEFEIVGTGGSYRSAGLNGGITGMGADYGIIDDPVKDAKEADSPVFRESQWEWYNTTFSSRLEKDASILITLTRWHEDDIVGRLLKLAKSDPRADQWVVVRFPAMRDLEPEKDPDNYGAKFDKRKVGEALWPWKYPVKRLEARKASNGSRAWLSLYQQTPTSDKGGIIKRSWIHHYTVVPPVFDRIVTSWDFTFKDKDTSDFVVGQAWGKKDGQFYLLDEVRARLGFTESVAAVKIFAAKWQKASRHLIEDKANGPAVQDALKKKLTRLVLVNPQGGKIARTHAIEGLWEAGNVLLPPAEKAPWIHDWVEEIVNFPNATHDDRVDAMSQGLLFLEGGAGSALAALTRV